MDPTDAAHVMSETTDAREASARERAAERLDAERLRDEGALSAS